MGLLKRAASALGMGGKTSMPARKEPRVRSFRMAKRDRLTDSWSRRSSAGDADQVIYRDHDTLRQRAREQSINSGIARRFYRLLRQNVIGPHGIKLQSQAERPNGDADDRWRTEIEWEFTKWSKRGQCDVTGRYSFVTFLWLWQEVLARDGEVLVRLVRNWSNRWGFALQILEADRLDTTLNTWLENGNRVRMGVEIDAWERPVAYWMLKDHPGDVWVSPGNKWERILADELIHTFDPWRPHQSRGFTWTHASANELHHVDEYAHAELVAAEDGAKITGHYVQDPEWMDEPEGDDDQGVLDERVEAGTARLLPWGTKFEAYDNKHPSTNFAPFTKAALRKVAAGLGPSYNRLAHDLEGVNYSSLRSGEIDERDFYKCCQQFVISELLDRVGEEWLKCSTLTGALRIPPQSYERLTYIAWLPRGWDWVDPAKDSKAAREDYDLGIESLSNLIRRRGGDPDEVFRQRAADKAKLEKLGLHQPITKTGAPDGTKSEDDEDEDAVNASGTD